MSGLVIAVVVGGPSVEAEVSRTGGQAVKAALERASHQVHLLELTRALPAELARAQVVFPVTHGRLGEDGCLQGLLEVLAVPYVGSGVLASALAADKNRAKTFYVAAGLPVAEHVSLRRSDALAASVREARARLGRAVVAKPACGGSAIGVELVRAEATDAEAQAAVERVLNLDDVALVEEFVQGQEVTCGVLERRGELVALPPTLIRPKGQYYDFESKYRVGASEHVCPAPFSADLVAHIQGAALAAHRALGCRDLSRSDFLVDAERGAFVVLETNTLPGMTPTSLFPEAAAQVGLEFEQLCDELVRAAFNRPALKLVRAPAMP